MARQAAEEAKERIRQMSELVAAEKERLRVCAEEHAEQVKVNLTKEAEAVIHRERLEKSQIASSLDETTRRLQQAEYERETLRQQASVEINQKTRNEEELRQEMAKMAKLQAEQTQREAELLKKQHLAELELANLRERLNRANDDGMSSNLTGESRSSVRSRARQIDRE